MEVEVHGALGEVFEAYVGDQLRLIDAATILEQVRFVSNGSDAASCDWFVVTDDVLVLVEVKCARPTIDYRTGDSAGLKDTERKLGDAVGQLEDTAKSSLKTIRRSTTSPSTCPSVG